MIYFADKNFFSKEFAYLVNPVNCQGVMGAGLALQFKNNFPPDMFDSYMRACLSRSLEIGKLHVWQGSDSRTVINLPTKDDWRQPSKIEYVQLGLDALANFLSVVYANLSQQADESKVLKVAVPALGCGNGGLQFDEVFSEIKARFDYCDSRKMKIVVFPPDPWFREKMHIELSHGRKIFSRQDDDLKLYWFEEI